MLSGSTTNGIISILKLYLSEQGVRLEFYHSEYAIFWEDAVFY